MLASFRKIANTWPARIFFIVLAVSFASWGVADMARRIVGGSDAVATVRGHEITPAEFASEYRQTIQQYAQQLPDPSQIPPSLRAQIASQTVTKLVTQAALAQQEDALGITVPDSAVREQVFAMPDFHGLDGKFDRRVLLQALARNNLTESKFLDLVRADLRQNQIIQTVTASADAPPLLTQLVFRYLGERRTADILMLPFQGQPLPPPPPLAILHRYYDNNPAKFTAPELRHIHVAILSPETIGRGLSVPEADLRAWFAQHQKDYVAPEKRSVEVITTESKATADTLAKQWRAGASWDAVQAAARALHATTVPLDNATKTQIPSPELAEAAFAAPLNTVTGPVAQALGFYVLRVTNITPAKNPSFEDVRNEIRAKASAEKALDVIDARAQKFQDLFAGGAKIDEVPADLGAVGAEGTLDAQGNAADGTPAPIPGSPDLRKAIIATVFTTKPGDQPQPLEGPDHAWYALSVDNIVKPTRKPFEEVQDLVTLEWQRDQVRHKQDSEAATLLSAIKSGQSLKDAAWASGFQVTRTPPLVRGKPQNGLSAEFIARLFTLKSGQGAEMETNAGFIVAQLADIIPPDAKTDPRGMKVAQDGLSQALHDDYLAIYAAALRDEAKPVEHLDVVEKLTQQAGE